MLLHFTKPFLTALHRNAPLTVIQNKQTNKQTNNEWKLSKGKIENPELSKNKNLQNDTKITIINVAPTAVT